VPSDRDIPRAVNEGKSILATNPQSEASNAFRQLGAMFVHEETAVAVAGETGLRRLFGKKA
jgi:MinD-like ATPase involved in chromosome partitioning or flagellar assembly